MPYRAGFWIRLLATAIDIVVMVLIGVGVAAVTEMAVAAISYSIAPTGLAALVYAMWLAYTSMEIWFAATPGKMIFRLRVGNADCSEADFWRLFLRWSTKWSWLFLSFVFMLTEWPPLYLLSGFISLVVVIGCLFAANDDRMTWHDQWARTAVCHLPRRYRSFEAIMPPPLPPNSPPPTA
jgi:uncharacterized RDD family membrane protein YckC